MTDSPHLVDMSAMMQDATAELEQLRATIGCEEALKAAAGALVAVIFFISEEIGHRTIVNILYRQADFLSAAEEVRRADESEARH